jgi:hypothetical protein
MTRRPSRPHEEMGARASPTRHKQVITGGGTGRIARAARQGATGCASGLRGPRASETAVAQRGVK